MKKAFTVTLIVLAILALAVGIFFAGSMFARLRAYGFNGMMGGYGWNTDSSNGFGPGMMGGSRPGYGMMGRQGGAGMMQGYGSNSASATPLTLDEAKAAAERYLTSLNNSDLKISEIMIFDNNA